MASTNQKWHSVVYSCKREKRRDILKAITNTNGNIKQRIVSTNASEHTLLEEIDRLFHDLIWMKTRPDWSKVVC